MKKQKRTTITALWMMVLLIFLSLSAEASAADPAEKRAEDIVRVGYYENEIFQEGASSGQVRSGYAYDYYRKLSEYTGWEYEYTYGDFAELYQMLLDGEVDMLAGLARNEERAKIIGYPELAMGSETYNLVKHAGDEKITLDFSTLNGRKIGVLDSAMVGVLESFLKEHRIDAEVVIFPNHPDMLDAFDADQIDALVAESDGAYNRPNAELLYAFGNSDYYLCVSKARKDLLNELNRAQAQLMTEEPNYINSLRIKYYSSSISSKAFSQIEKEWLAENDHLRIGYLNHYLPYSDTDSEGQATGLVSELVPQFIEELGIKGLSLSFAGYDSYDDMIEAVRTKEIDAAFPVGGGLYFSEESGIYQSNPTVSTGTELIYAGEYNEEKLSLFAANENNRMQCYYIRTNFPDAKVIFYPTIEQCLEAVSDHKAGCTTLNGIRANDILKNRKYRDLSMKQLGKNDDRSFGVCIGNEGLLKLINRGINIIGEDRIQSLGYKYVDGLYTYTFLDMLQDHVWVFTLIVVAVAMLVVMFLVRGSVNAKKRMHEKEEARKELEEKNRELAIAVSEAESANRAKSYFLSTMSHDIRTPMNSILSMNEMVLRECDNEDILFYAGHIRSSGNTLLALISDILDFSKIEAGKMEIIPVDYEISSVLNDLVKILQTRAEENGLQIELDVDSSMPNYLHGDEIRIKQAVTNLLTNAVKYTKKGVVSFSMNYKKIPDEDDAIMLHVSVRDTGIGIRKEDINRLFETFERLDEAQNRNIEGTGLDITITQRILNMMGSTLEVESEYGKGSCFSFSIKQKVCKWEEVGDFEKAFRRSVAERQKYQEKFTAPDASILVVDDMPENLTVIKSLLKHTKLNIDTAKSADDCIQLASQRKYDMIFLDHMMPYKDGIEALRELKALDDNPNANTPMICLTANAISGMRETYIAAGFDDYITKPVDPDRLEETILQYLPEDKIAPPDASQHETGAEALPRFLYDIRALDISAGLKHCGGSESFLDAIKEFQERSRETADSIEAYREAGDIRNMTVKIHGVKSTARIIGAMELGDFAERLEKAGNENDTNLLDRELAGFLEDYRALGRSLSPVAEASWDVTSRPLLSPEELQDIYASLRRYVEQSDFDEIERIGERLENYRAPLSEEGKVFKILGAISELDFEELAVLI